MPLKKGRDRIEGVFEVVGLGVGTDPEKIQEMLERQEEMENLVDLYLLKKKLREKKSKKRINPYSYEDTFERADSEE